ncbi:hypothetical protein ACFQ08_35535, partial [Streptosporangium algeriense]
ATFEAASSRDGWLRASWSVAHAQKFGLRRVRYGGQAWTSANGEDGWRSDTTTPTGKVDIS